MAADDSDEINPSFLDDGRKWDIEPDQYILDALEKLKLAGWIDSYSGKGGLSYEWSEKGRKRRDLIRALMGEIGDHEDIEWSVVIQLVAND